jgi:hypothetical protein
MSVAAPVTVRERLLVAVTVYVASMTATAAPTAAVAADAEPEAVVVTDAVCVAETASAPPSVVGPPEPIDASVVTVAIVTATDGTIAMPPPAAPLVDAVVSVSVLVAVNVRFFALSVDALARAACVLSVTRFSATAAPTPEPDVPAVAVAEDVVDEVAMKLASADAVASDPVSSASVCAFAIVSASDPATPTEAAAPEIASLEEPAPPLVACTVAPPVADAFAAIDALLVTFASVTATAAAIAAEPPAAEPSAFEAAAAVSDDVTVSTPPTDTVIPPWSVAFAEAVAIVTAIAAATDTGPVDVDADGAEPALDPEPPLPDERPPAFERSPAT